MSGSPTAWGGDRWGRRTVYAERVRRRCSALGPIAAVVLIGACGSSTRPATVSTSSGALSRTAPSSYPATSSGSGAPAPVPGGAAGPPGPSAGSTRGSPTAGATQVRLPAAFVIRPGGRLDPPSVTSPALLTVDLTVASGDRGSHRVVLRTPAIHTLVVPARGRASVLLAGLRSGRYELKVDGVVRGALVIGGQPGP